jgi:hypothetical protein
MIFGALISGFGSLFSGAIGASGASAAGTTIGNMGTAAGQSLDTATTQGQANVSTAGSNAQQVMAGATTNATQGEMGAIQGANQGLSNVYGQQQSNLNPYLATGSNATQMMNTALAPGGALAGQFTAPTAQQVQNTPGYQFQLQQGQQAVQRQAAASGLLNSGGTAKALDQYSQGLASTYYQNAFNNSLQGYQTNYSNTLNSLGQAQNMGLNASSQFNQAAMNYGNTSGANIMQGQAIIGNTGMTGAQSEAATGVNTAEYGANLGVQGTNLGANYFMQGAEGTAAGQMGTANAMNNMVGGLSGSLANYGYGTGTGYGVGSIYAPTYSQSGAYGGSANPNLQYSPSEPYGWAP